MIHNNPSTWWESERFNIKLLTIIVLIISVYDLIIDLLLKNVIESESARPLEHRLSVAK